MEALKEEKQRHKFSYPESVEWKEISKKVKSIAIVGITGSGKTSLAYKIIESFDKVVDIFKHPNVSILNERGYKQLHELADFEKLHDCVVFIDEPQLYIKYYESKSNVILMRLLSLCRQRNITLILVTSDTRFITRGLESYIDIWILKDLEFDLVKQGSMIRKIIKANSFIIEDGFSLDIAEYIFYSRLLRDYNGKHKFNQPVYFDDRYSKPYNFKTTKETPLKTQKN